MSFELLCGGFGTALQFEIKNRIKCLAEKGVRSILIVPEQFSVSAEKEMYRELGSSSPIFFELSNFTRLANSTARALGGLSNVHTDRARRALAMWQVLSELSPALKSFGTGKEISTSQVNRAISAVNELHGYGISNEMLDDATRELADKSPRLADKLSDISMISSLYKSLLQKKYSDTGDDIELLATTLEENPDYLRDTEIFVEGFTSFTEPQYKILSLLMKRTRLTVALTLSKHFSGSFEFRETTAARAKLIKLANKNRIIPKEHFFQSCATVKSPLLYETSGLLFKSFGEIDKEYLNESAALRIFEAIDPYEECAFIAEDIKRRVMLGEKYSDFAIVARNTDKYIGTLDDALAKAKIPHFISKTRSIMSFEATKLIFSALETLADGYRQEDIISFLKSGFSGISREACDKFDIYCEMWQIDGKAILSDTDFTMSVSGYSSRKKENDADELSKINETKRTLVQIFKSLEKSLKNASTIREFATGLVEFTSSLALEEKITERSRALYSISENEAAEENSALWKAICNALDTLVSASGDAPADIESFKNRFELVLSESKIGRIPSYRDNVTVGSADLLRLFGKKHLYLIGVNLGEFPAIPQDSAFFADKEKALLSGIGIELENDTEYRFSREMFYFTRAFASASESVTLLFALSDFGYKAQTPSEVIVRIGEISGGSIVPCKISELPISDTVYTEEKAITLANTTQNQNLKNCLKELGLGEKLSYSEQDIKNEELFLSAELARHIYGGDMALTQTRIDRFIDCPLSYFCEYKLKLSECERAEFDARSIGSFIHSILENFFKDAKASGKEINSLSYEEKAHIAEDAARAYLDSLGSEISGKARTRFALERLKRTALPVIDGLCDELTNCNFEPAFFELEIGKGNDGPDAPEFKTDDGHIRIYGSIDRVDTYKSGNDVYVRVIDYKTGAKNFSPDDLDEGRNMQMFLYLKAIVDSKKSAFISKLGVENDGRLIPAGVIYIKTDMSDVRIEHSDDGEALAAIKDKQRREGMLLDNEVSIMAQNPSYIPVSFKKDGTPTARSEKLLYTEAAWEKITEKLTAAVIRVSEGMKSGNTSAAPMKNKKTSPCEYCKFKPICRNAAIGG